MTNMSEYEVFCQTASALCGVGAMVTLGHNIDKNIPIMWPLIALLLLLLFVFLGIGLWIKRMEIQDQKDILWAKAALPNDDATSPKKKSRK